MNPGLGLVRRSAQIPPSKRGRSPDGAPGTRASQSKLVHPPRFKDRKLDLGAAKSPAPFAGLGAPGTQTPACLSAPPLGGHSHNTGWEPSWLRRTAPTPATLGTFSKVGLEEGAFLRSETESPATPVSLTHHGSVRALGSPSEAQRGSAPPPPVSMSCTSLVLTP